MQDFPQGDELEDAGHMNRVIEQAVLECVPQYFWTMKWFRTRPEGGAEIYAEVPDGKE